LKYCSARNLWNSECCFAEKRLRSLPKKSSGAGMKAEPPYWRGLENLRKPAGSKAASPPSAQLSRCGGFRRTFQSPVRSSPNDQIKETRSTRWAHTPWLSLVPWEIGTLGGFSFGSTRIWTPHAVLPQNLSTVMGTSMKKLICHRGDFVVTTAKKLLFDHTIAKAVETNGCRLGGGMWN